MFNYLYSGGATISVGVGNIWGRRIRSGSGGAAPDFWEILKFCKDFLKKIAKNSLVQPIIKQKFKNLTLIFRAFGPKIQIHWKKKTLKVVDKNSIENLNFELLLRKLLIKTEPSDIRSAAIFFHFGGRGGRSLWPRPGRGYAFNFTLKYKCD